MGLCVGLLKLLTVTVKLIAMTADIERRMVWDDFDYVIKMSCSQPWSATLTVRHHRDLQ